MSWPTVILGCLCLGLCVVIAGQDVSAGERTNTYRLDIQDLKQRDKEKFDEERRSSSAEIDLLSHRLANKEERAFEANYDIDTRQGDDCSWHELRLTCRGIRDRVTLTSVPFHCAAYGCEFDSCDSAK